MSKARSIEIFNRTYQEKLRNLAYNTSNDAKKSFPVKQGTTMTTSIQAQLQNLKDKIVTTKSQAVSEGDGYAINQAHQAHNYNGKNSAYVWRIVRNGKLFNRFDVIETCTNKVQKSCLDLDAAQELVELHNQQVEKWWEVKSSQPLKQYKQCKQHFHTV